MRIYSFLFCVLASMACLTAQDSRLLTRRSPIPQPYGYVTGGAMKGLAVPDSPDPLVSYVWDNPQASDPLQIYVVRPVLAEVVEGSPQAFEGIATAGRENCSIRVKDRGVLRLDFGVELPAWIEIDSPDLNGDVQLAVSEYNTYELILEKATPKAYGRTYRLELNRELYEGVRYGFICVNSLQREFTISSIRAVCQTKPANYMGRFDCDNPLINKIWYVGAYDVRANQREDCFGAILLDRGDRFSWTGDAYPSQAASLVAFANYDEVLKNLHWTEGHPNGIETYELYWVESLIDYYMYSGDERGFRELLPLAQKRLDHAWDIFDMPSGLFYLGWDQRLGTGFDYPNRDEGRWTYRMLAIGAWKHMAKVLRMVGETTRASELEERARMKGQVALRHLTLPISTHQKAGSWGPMGMHASADAINADLVADVQRLYHPDLADRERRLSYSPFNQCFLLKAMAHAGHYDDAFASVLDQWGGQIEYGGTCFFEVFRPDWIQHIGKNGPIPYSQAGFTSLAHPWGAGVVQWLSEEMLGIRPLTGGFRTFSVKPHLQGVATRVQGHTHTPQGDILASFDLNTGRHSLTVPAGCTATLGIPKEGMRITALTMNGKTVTRYTQDAQFVYLDHLSEGTYDVQVSYQGLPTPLKKGEFTYAVQTKEIDRETHGEWYKRYGKEGRYIVCGAENGDDLQQLPDYVESVGIAPGEAQTVQMMRADRIVPLDERAKLPVSAQPGARKAFACYYSRGCQMNPIEIKLKEKHPYQLAIYMADCDRGGRDVLVEVFDLQTMNRISPCTHVRDFAGGVYVVYDLDSSVSIMSSNVRGDNAVWNALFFDSQRK